MVVFGNNENSLTVVTNWVNAKQEIKFANMNYLRITDLYLLNENTLATGFESQNFKLWKVDDSWSFL